MSAEYRIDRLGTAGDGIAPGPVHVAGTLPGETVRATPIAPDRAVLDAVLHASPERAAPPCGHAAICGACALQHWALPAQAEWKRGRVEAALRRAGHDVPVQLAHQSRPGTRRRADLSVLRRPDGTVTIGFHGPAGVLDIPDCRLLHPALLALLPRLADAMRSLSGFNARADAAINLLDTGPDILLRLDATLSPHDAQRLAWFAEDAGIPRIATRAGIAVQRAPVHHAFAGHRVVPPPGAFLQATADGEAAIIAAVLAALPAKRKRGPILDLFAGIGTLSFPLAERAPVQAFEGAADAAAALDAGARAAGGRVTARRRDLFRQPLLPAEMKAAGAIVLDPPYAGAADQIGQITRAPGPPLVYVSCNPVALERDARALHAAGYRATSGSVIDQFLWSAHVEAVVGFTAGR